MFEAWSEECILRFPDGDFKAQELANAVWAVATAGFEASDEFWDSAARAAVPLMRDPEQAQTQNIANCLWSYAKSGDGTPSVRKELFSELADASSKRVDEFNAQELGNTVRRSFLLERSLLFIGLGVRDGGGSSSRIVRRHRGERRGPRRALHRPEPGKYGLGLRDGVAPGAAFIGRRRARSGAQGRRVQAPGTGTCFVIDTHAHYMT
jgi:hypothetical protein